LVYNNQELASVNSCLQIYGNDVQDELDEAEDENEEPKDKKVAVAPEHSIESIAHIGFSVQRSNPIYSISVLRSLYINGKVDFIMKMLIQMNAVLKQEVLDMEKTDQ